MKTMCNKISENHQQLSPLALDFIQYAQDSAPFEQQLSVAQGGESLFAREYQFDLQLLPLFMTQQKSEEYGQAAVQVFNIYKNLILRLADDNPALLNKHFKSPWSKSPVEMLKAHTGLDYCLLRGDFAATDDGFKLMEFNISGNIGGWGIFLYEQMYREYPAVKQFLNEHADIAFSTHSPLNDMVKHIITVSYQFTRGRMPNIAAFLENPERRAQTEDMIGRFKQKLASMGIKVEFTILTQDARLEEVDGELVTDNGVIDSMLLMAPVDYIPAFVHEKSERGEFPIFNNRAANLLNQKTGMCLLSEYADWRDCPSEEKQLIDEHVPWTRFLSEGPVMYKGEQFDMHELVIAHKDLFVIKPSDGLQGDDVSVGNRIDQQRWIELVEAAFATNNFIVQEYCQSKQLMALNKTGEFVPHDVVWAPFVFGGNYAGNYVRLSPSDNETGVINAHRGASDAFIFLHD